MSRSGFEIGIVFPQTEIGADPIVIRDFAQAVEDLGFDKLLAYDHVVGADVSNRPDWAMPYTHETMFHEPLSLFSYLAGLTRRLILMSGVIVLPQRQTVLFAKQAANVDVFSGGRLRLGVGIGWNSVEYEALNVDFSSRGRIFEDQLRLLRRLWTEPSLTEHGEFHSISEAGINPLPVQRPIPLIIGGPSEIAQRRAARMGDGWVPVIKDRTQAEQAVERFRTLVLEAGRDPGRVRLENNIILGAKLGMSKRGIADALEEARAWQDAGARGVTFDIMDMGFERPDEHIQFVRRLAQELQLDAPQTGPASLCSAS